MTKNYYVKERMVAARPRSKRLRMLGGSTSSGTSSVSYSAWEPSGSSGGGFTLTVSGGNNAIVINGTTLNLAHNHDWGDIVNKPNLVEGVTAGNGKLSFLHSNGDVTVADFSALLTTLAGKASATSVNAMSNTVDAVKENTDYLMSVQGEPITPYVWGTTADRDAEDWEGCEGLFFFNSSNNTLHVCIGYSTAFQQYTFTQVFGMHLLYDEANNALLMHYSKGSTNVLKTIITVD